MATEEDPAAFTRYKRFTHEEYGIDYNAMNLVDDFTDGSGKEALLWLVADWIRQESTKSRGVWAGGTRMLAARLEHELGLQGVERPNKADHGGILYEVSLWLVADWIRQESTRAVGTLGGGLRMLANQLEGELRSKGVERPNKS